MSMTQSEFKRILRDYDRRQSFNHQRHLKQMDEVYAKVPEVKDIQLQIVNAGRKAIQEVLANPTSKDAIDAKMKTTISDLKTQKKQLLNNAGYDESYLEPIYTCHDCKDTGFIEREKCHCLKQAIIDYAYEQSNLKEVLSKENFSTFSFDFYSKKADPQLGMSPYENMQSVQQICYSFCKNFEAHEDNLILYGGSGLGKTFLCNAIAKEVLDQGKTVIYLSAFQLFRLFENYRFRKEEEAVTYDDIESIFNCDLLIIDDLGTEFSNTLTNAELFNCLNSRLLSKKSTVISTNLHPNDWIKKYSERILSRLFGYYTQLKFFGSDIRMSKYS